MMKYLVDGAAPVADRSGGARDGLTCDKGQQLTYQVSSIDLLVSQ